MAADAYYDKVVLLLPMNGADGGTTFTDYSQRKMEVFANGGVKTETDRSKYYGSSGYFDGTGDYLSLYDTNYLYFNGDFCIEAWVSLTALPEAGIEDNQIRMIYCDRDRLSDAYRIFFGVSYWQGSQTSPGLWFQINNSTNVLSLIGSPTSAMQANTWYHCAATVSSGTGRIFIDGKLINSALLSGSVPNISWIPVIGTGWSGYFDFHGYMQDLRITKGVARYTDTFTPPGKLVGTISGTIYDANGDAAQRTVIAVPRSYPNSRTFTTQSSAANGTYSLSVPDVECSRIVLADETTLYNDILDRVLPG